MTLLGFSWHSPGHLAGLEGLTPARQDRGRRCTSPGVRSSCNRTWCSAPWEGQDVGHIDAGEDSRPCCAGRGGPATMPPAPGTFTTAMDRPTPSRRNDRMRSSFGGAAGGEDNHQNRWACLGNLGLGLSHWPQPQQRAKLRVRGQDPAFDGPLGFISSLSLTLVVKTLALKQHPTGVGLSGDRGTTTSAGEAQVTAKVLSKKPALRSWCR